EDLYLSTPPKDEHPSSPTPIEEYPSTPPTEEHPSSPPPTEEHPSSTPPPEEHLSSPPPIKDPVEMPFPLGDHSTSITQDPIDLLWALLPTKDEASKFPISKTNFTEISIRSSSTSPTA
ncbi:hypothetical protein KI387_007000, partial [Taxus chinensis]